MKIYFSKPTIQITESGSLIDDKETIIDINGIQETIRVVETPEFYLNNIEPYLREKRKSYDNMDKFKLEEYGTLKIRKFFSMMYEDNAMIEKYLLYDEMINIREITVETIDKIKDYVKYKYSSQGDSSQEVDLYFQLMPGIPFITFVVIMQPFSNNINLPIHEQDRLIYFHNIIDLFERKIDLKKITFEYFVLKNVLNNSSMKYKKKYIYDEESLQVFFKTKSTVDKYTPKDIYFYTFEKPVKYIGSKISRQNSYAKTEILTTTKYFINTKKMESSLGYFEAYPNLHHSYGLDIDKIKRSKPYEIKQNKPFHYVAFFYSKENNISSLRNLNQSNIDEIYKQVQYIKKKIVKHFKLENDDIRIYIQAPNIKKYLQLHVHFMFVTNIEYGTRIGHFYQSREKTERKFAIDEVYYNIKYKSDFYENKTFYFLSNADNLVNNYPASYEKKT